MQKIRNSKAGKAASLMFGAAAVAPVAYDMITPQSAYCAENPYSAEGLVKILSDLPEPNVQNQAQRRIRKIVAANVLIDRYNADKIHGVQVTHNPDGTSTISTEGYVNQKGRCAGVQELYDTAKHMYGPNLNQEAQNRVGLGVLVRRAQECSCR